MAFTPSLQAVRLVLLPLPVATRVQERRAEAHEHREGLVHVLSSQQMQKPAHFSIRLDIQSVQISLDLV